MGKAINIHFNKVHKKKEHAASKCKNAKCFVCHYAKLLKIPSRKVLQEKYNQKEQMLSINS